eukprot:tig00020723_g13509.t1
MCTRGSGRVPPVAQWRGRAPCTLISHATAGFEAGAVLRNALEGTYDSGLTDEWRFRKRLVNLNFAARDPLSTDALIALAERWPPGLVTYDMLGHVRSIDNGQTPLEIALGRRDLPSSVLARLLVIAAPPLSDPLACGAQALQQFSSSPCPLRFLIPLQLAYAKAHAGWGARRPPFSPEAEPAAIEARAAFEHHARLLDKLARAAAARAGATVRVEAAAAVARPAAPATGSDAAPVRAKQQVTAQRGGGRGRGADAVLRWSFGEAAAGTGADAAEALAAAAAALEAAARAAVAAWPAASAKEA